MIKLIDILKEIRVNDPSLGFYFKVVDDGSGIEYMDTKTKKSYWAPYDVDDIDIHFNMGIEGDYDNIETGDPNDPQPFIDYIKDLNPDFDIEQFQSFINNLQKVRIPIEELDMIGDGGFIYINVTLVLKDIKSYIIK
jgi:hypothetical protein